MQQTERKELKVMSRCWAPLSHMWVVRLDNYAELRPVSFLHLLWINPEMNLKMI